MDKYYCVVERTEIYKPYKRGCILTAEKLNEDTIIDWARKIENKLGWLKDSAVITFIQKLEESEESDNG